MTLDLTANPDFSQVESDEPQVTINQRFEVFFPEKRPFFLENAGYFQTPINLFFSRRIGDPQIGARATGQAGRVGRRRAGASTTVRRATRSTRSTRISAIARSTLSCRVRREFGDSSVGALVTSRDFGPSSNRVVSARHASEAQLPDLRRRSGGRQRYRVDRGRAASRLGLLGHA